MTNNIKISLANIRISGRDKTYYLNQLQMFANNFDSGKIQAVSFGKQDIRGGVSITLIDNEHCVPKQRFFDSKDMMLGYVLGFNSAKDATNQYDEWFRFSKTGKQAA